MKSAKKFEKALGLNEFGIIDFPTKMSNVQLSRILYGHCSGCSHCFPHGRETINSTLCNNQRNWKKFRKTHWKSKVCKSE
jgi:hypothetical protein